MPNTRKSRRSSRHSRRGSGIRVHRKPANKNGKKVISLTLEELRRHTIAELQIIARSRGIPFGGMTKGQLIEKIVAYR